MPGMDSYTQAAGAKQLQFLMLGRRVPQVLGCKTCGFYGGEL